jgi:hypothetical protein
MAGWKGELIGYNSQSVYPYILRFYEVAQEGHDFGFTGRTTVVAYAEDEVTLLHDKTYPY